MPDRAVSGQDPYAAAGVDRVSLTDGGGRPLAVITPTERDGLPWADLVWTPPEVAPPAAAAALLETFAGAFASVEDAALAAELGGRGASVVRSAHGYTWDLRSRPADPRWLADAGQPAGCRLERLDEAKGVAEAAAIGACMAAAFGADHPDASPGDPARAVVEIVTGRALGPLLPGSTLALAGSAGRVVGALLLTDRDGAPPLGGPWVTEVFRDPAPEWAGLGAALLRRGLARSAADGLPAVGLVVSEGNPARRVYARLGFAPVGASWTLRLPTAH